MNIPTTLGSAGALAEAAETARRTLIRRGRSYARLHGADLLDLLGAQTGASVLRDAEALLHDLERIERWRNSVRGRIERIAEALDRIQRNPHAGSGARQRARAHRALIGRLAGLDDRVREARLRAVVALPLGPLLDRPASRIRSLGAMKGDAT